MGLLDFIKKLGGEDGPSEPPDFSSMSRDELDRQFTPSRWEKLQYSDRCECVRELERRFAREQGRPAKDIRFVPMEGGTFGGWSKADDCIYVNDTLVSDGCFTIKGHMTDPQPSAPFQIYDTVAHEGYHAYQSYALEHPEVHADKAQLEEWRLNSAEGFPKGVYEDN